MGTGLKVPKPQRKTTIELGTHKVKDNCSHASETTIPGTLRTRNDRNFSVSLADRSHWEHRLSRPADRAPTRELNRHEHETETKPRLALNRDSEIRASLYTCWLPPECNSCGTTASESLGQLRVTWSKPLRKGSYPRKSLSEKKRVRTLGTKGSELKESALSELRFRTIVKRFRTEKVVEPSRKGSYLSRMYIGTKRVRTLGTKGSELKESALSELRFRTIVKRFRTVKKKLWNIEKRFLSI